eukprot:TRINITY_DN5758_c0_g1_i2.p1 TRINITY_DN5758_c0_g1~~TRINITY_DN5758_c0_g1_i2.p1  ORF type:complete len:929 (-),score=304.85 TRINITY_DN5758_c0_g1_i2:109-2895(-)
MAVSVARVAGWLVGWLSGRRRSGAQMRQSDEQRSQLQQHGTPLGSCASTPVSLLAVWLACRAALDMLDTLPATWHSEYAAACKCLHLPGTQLGADLAGVVHRVEFADLQLQPAGDEQPQRQPLYASRFILSSRSDYFRSLLTNPMRESLESGLLLPSEPASSPGLAQLPTSFSFGVLKGLVEYMYTGNAGLSVPVVNDVYGAADLMCLWELRDQCDAYINEAIGVGTVVTLAKNAYMLDQPPLQQLAFEFFVRNASAVFAEQEAELLALEWQLLEVFLSQLYNHLLDDDDSNVPQLQAQVLAFGLRWAARHCQPFRQRVASHDDMQAAQEMRTFLEESLLPLLMINKASLMDYASALLHSGIFAPQLVRRAFSAFGIWLDDDSAAGSLTGALPSGGGTGTGMETEADGSGCQLCQAGVVYASRPCSCTVGPLPPGGFCKSCQMTFVVRSVGEACGACLWGELVRFKQLFDTMFVRECIRLPVRGSSVEHRQAAAASSSDDDDEQLADDIRLRIERELQRERDAVNQPSQPFTLPFPLRSPAKMPEPEQRRQPQQQQQRTAATAATAAPSGALDLQPLSGLLGNRPMRLTTMFRQAALFDPADYARFVPPPGVTMPTMPATPATPATSAAAAAARNVRQRLVADGNGSAVYVERHLRRAASVPPHRALSSRPTLTALRGAVFSDQQHTATHSVPSSLHRRPAPSAASSSSSAVSSSVVDCHTRYKRFLARLATDASQPAAAAASDDPDRSDGVASASSSSSSGNNSSSSPAAVSTSQAPADVHTQTVPRPTTRFLHAPWVDFTNRLAPVPDSAAPVETASAPRPMGRLDPMLILSSWAEFELDAALMGLDSADALNQAFESFTSALQDVEQQEQQHCEMCMQQAHTLTCCCATLCGACFRQLPVPKRCPACLMPLFHAHLDELPPSANV